MDKIVTGHRPSAPPGSQPAPACTLVVFGAGGDLTARLLVPSLYNLELSGLLGEGFALHGLDLATPDEAAWKAHLSDTMESFTKDPDAEFHPDRIDAGTWDRLMGRATYEHADFTDPDTFKALAQRLGDGSAIFYFAVPARFFGPIADALGAAGLLAQGAGQFRRIVIEKPFGSDLSSARDLNTRLLNVAREDQIFRIDHFMGKEAVQSILALRFANRLFEPLWRAEHIAEIEITAAETLGVEGRGRFYEQTGALRDMVPNHLFQLLCMVAMEPPTSLDAEAIRSEKTRLLRCVRALQPGDAIFGQYGAGQMASGAVPAYRDEPDVAPDSTTETYVAMRLFIDNWRWSGTRFVVRTGKRLHTRRTQIVLRFRPTPFDLFAAEGHGVAEQDQIVLSIAPDNGIDISFAVKRPGPGFVPARAETHFRFDEAFEERPNVGYEALLYDCMIGDATLFQRADTIEEAWRIVDPALNADAKLNLQFYEAGSEGLRFSEE